MNIFLINSQKAKIYPQIFKEYLTSKGVNCYNSRGNKEEIKSLIVSKKLSPLNTLIYARTAGPHITQIYKELESKGYKIINKSTATELTSNKYESQIFAQKNGIPVAHTYKVSKKEIQKIKELLNKYSSVIVKPILSQGQGLFCKKIDKDMTRGEIVSLIADIPGEDIIVQEKIEYKKLIRVIVIGFRVLKNASTYDAPVAGNWKASVCMNPNIKKYKITNYKLLSLAEKIAKIFDCGVSFIDFFEDKNGKFILNELNTACGLIVHEEITGVKIYKHISKYLIAEAPKG